MRKYYQFFGLALIMVFSFYYTEQIARIVLNKNPLMVTINKEAKNYNVLSVNAIIDGEYIVPGINGLKVDAKESFYKMQEAAVFNKYFLVYNQIKPDISLENNKDKLIRNGNRKVKQVSFILEEKNEVSEYFKNKGLKASLLANLDNYQNDKTFQIINNEVEGFKSLENMLNLNKNNQHICVINSDETNKDVCLKNKNYLIKPFLILSKNNVMDIKRKIDNGSIILIKKNASLSDVLLLLKEVKYKDLEVVYLSEIISEENGFNIN